MDTKVSRFSSLIVAAVSSIGLLALAFFSSGLAPQLYRYKHVVLHARAGLEVLDRSTTSPDAAGMPLSGAKVGFPLACVISAQEYAITVGTPLNSAPVLFLRAEDRKKAMLQLRGAHLVDLDPRSGMFLKGFRYSFLILQADGAPLEFDVIAEDGHRLGRERLRYDLVSRGYKWESPL